MTDQEFREVYEISRVSLRENLVPLSKFYEQVKSVESAPFICLHTDDDGLDVTDRWVCPYPYTEPAWVTILRQQNQSYGVPSAVHLTRDILDAAVKQISMRTEAHVLNSIPGDYLAAIDEDYDTGVILHRLTGRIVPFDYSEVTGWNITRLASNVLILIGAQHDVNNGRTFGPEDITAIREQVRERNGTFEMWIEPLYRTEQCDRWHAIPFVDTVTDRLSIGANDSNQLVEYLRVMTDQHAKVLHMT